MPKVDLLIKGGEVIDPASKTRGKLDVAVSQGRIAAIGPDLPLDAASQVDATGKLVVPGLIDLHTHLGFELHTVVLDPDDVCPPAGVTAAVDMGSTGAFTFPWYRERVLSRTLVRLFPFINIASIGAIAIHTPYYVDNYGRYIDVRDTVRMIQENRQYIRGIKVFATDKMVGEWALMAVRAARQVGDEVGLPVAVHVSALPPPLEEILDLLHEGDILTHSFTPHDQGILDARGQIRSSVREARQRGVFFDLGHGAGSFAYHVARKALEQDFLPDTISTDLYYANVDQPVKDLPTTLSKFLNLGLSLEETLARATCNPARLIGENTLGVLQVGGPADIALLTLQQGEFSYVDCVQQTLTGPWKLECAMTIARGKIIYPREGWS